MSEDKYRQAARTIVKAGFLPFPINNTLIRLLKLLIDEEQLGFIMSFRRKTSQTMEELKKSSKMTEDEIETHVKNLAKKGFLFNQPNSKGVMVYRLMPLLMVGAFEYTFMKKIQFSDDNKEIAELFAQLFSELANFVQGNYDTILTLFRNLPPFDRTIPFVDNLEGKEIQININTDIDVPEEKIILTQNVKNLIQKFDEIAVGHCFCRQHQDLLLNPCKQTTLRENCFTFGKSARYVVEQGFGRMISKEEALNLFKKSEEDGLIHKTWHPHSDISKAETSVCNCCKCCCGTFDWWRQGTTAMINSTNYLSYIDKDKCVGCGTCMEKCPVDAIEGDDNNKAERKAEWCIGCGICAHFCPENAISLLEGQRKVFIPPPRLR
ncbi:MAG: 4Fe-4S binding protein [Promethearchaeota archaeon]|nr:MAG: 4Fe-4S binding protein [Candidatus Lokiarchaeota archaeon]